MEEFKDLKELIKKELKEVANKGLSSSNLESTYKLVDILKDLTEVESESKEKYQNGQYGQGGQDGQYGMMDYRYVPQYMGSGAWRGYMEGDYNSRGYGMDGYRERGGYGEQYNNQGGRSYNGPDRRMRDRIERVIEGAEVYDYGRDRYQHGGSHEAMEEGLEKMMYAVCMLVETAMDAAQSPKEKEIIRKHIQKIKAL